MFFLFWISLGFRKGRSELLTISTLAVICLLPAYHRNYDAALLVFPLAWSISQLAGGSSTTAKVILALMLPFAIPGPSILRYYPTTEAYPLFSCKAGGGRR
jgi:hypothetical protein